MKIRMNFGVVKTILLAVVTLGALAIVGLDIAMLAGANGVYTDSPAIAIVSLVAATLIALAALLVLFNSAYRFKTIALWQRSDFSLTKSSMTT